MCKFRFASLYPNYSHECAIMYAYPRDLYIFASFIVSSRGGLLNWDFSPYNYGFRIGFLNEFLTVPTNIINTTT